jgi:three-Cys-motif partner protein
MEEQSQLFPFSEIPARAARRGPKSRPNMFEEVRIMGTWTLDKLQVLELYLKVYRRVAGSGTYIDAFAGEGRIVVNGEERDGSASLAVRAGAFRQLFFMEKDPGRNARLDSHLTATFPRVRAKCEVLTPGDANVQVPELLGSERIDRERPCFALLDQDSTQLDWSTLETLAGFKTFDATTSRCKVELWILFNTHQVIQRLWPSDRQQPNRFKRTLDRVMGSRAAWQDLYVGSGTAKDLMERYAHRLESELGYLYVDHQAIRDHDSRRDQYHMIHASDHPAAVDFMVWARRASEKDKLHALAEELPFPAAL